MKSEDFNIGIEVVSNGFAVNEADGKTTIFTTMDEAFVYVKKCCVNNFKGEGNEERMGYVS